MLQKNTWGNVIAVSTEEITFEDIKERSINSNVAANVSNWGQAFVQDRRENSADLNPSDAIEKNEWYCKLKADSDNQLNYLANLLS